MQKLVTRLDLHDKQTQKYIIYMVFGVLCVLAVLVRASLIKFQNVDYSIFSSWYDFAKLHGIHSLKYGYSDGFSNYNPPYAYFLYIATLLPLSKIVAIKGILAFFDVIMAVSIYCLVKLFRPGGYVALATAIGSMFVPTVLITGVMWGQFDQLYTAFILFSLYFGLRQKSQWAWAMFGIAIAVKFQAIFFLPVLAILSFKRIRWFDSWWAVLSFLILTLPPALLGRPVSSLLTIYPDQAKLFGGRLTLNAPNVYQWVPNSTYPYLNKAGIILAMAAVLFLLIHAITNRKYKPKQLLLATTFLLFLVPFLLPAMHERYFFPAGIASFVLACVDPAYVWIAVIAQAITIFSYSPFLFGTTPIPFTILSLGMLVIVYALGAYYYRSTD